MKITGIIITILITFSGFSQGSAKFILGTQSNLIYKPIDYLQSVYVGIKIKRHNIHLGMLLYSNLLEKEVLESYPEEDKHYSISANYLYEFERTERKVHPFVYLTGTYLRANSMHEDSTLNEPFTVGRRKQWVYSTLGLGIEENLSPNITLKQSLGIGVGYTVFKNSYLEGYYYNKTYTTINQASTKLIGSFNFTIEFRIPIN